MAKDWIENKLVGDVSDGLGPDSLPQDLIVMWGFPAIGKSEDYDRLYLSLAMNEYIEFPHSGLVHVEDAGGPDNPFSGSMVWLKRETSIKHVKAESLDLQRGFLQGGIAGSYTTSGTNMTANNAMAGGGGTLLCGGAGTLLCGGAGTLLCGGAGSMICGGGGTLLCGAGGAEK